MQNRGDSLEDASNDTGVAKT